jgi:hypothetical protein
MVGARKGSSGVLDLWVRLPGEEAQLLHDLKICRNGRNDPLSRFPTTSSFIPTDPPKTASSIVYFGLASAEER